MKHRPLSKIRQKQLDDAFRRSWREDARVSQKSRCDYCREPLTARSVTADHVIPRHAHGPDERNNIVAACEPCNALKRHMPAALFRKMIAGPQPGMPVGFFLAWSRLRINRRLEKMERFFDRFYGRPAR